MRRYTYLGDKHTCEQLRGQPCIAVCNVAGNCIRGRNGNMLVQFENGKQSVVPARRLRKKNAEASY